MKHQKWRGCSFCEKGKGTEPAQRLLDEAVCCAGLEELKKVLGILTLTANLLVFRRLFALSEPGGQEHEPGGQEHVERWFAQGGASGPRAWFGG